MSFEVGLESVYLTGSDDSKACDPANFYQTPTSWTLSGPLVGFLSLSPLLKLIRPRLLKESLAVSPSEAPTVPPCTIHHTSRERISQQTNTLSRTAPETA